MRLGKCILRRAAMVAAAAVLAAVAALTACSSSGDPGTQFGPPGSLDLQQFPDPPDAAALGCEASLEPAQEDGGCSVSWATTIYPKLQAAGVWKCGNGAGCHGTDR